MMRCVTSVEQTSLTWPHFFSYSYYLVLYSFVLSSNILQSTEIKMSQYSKRLTKLGNSIIVTQNCINNCKEIN